MNFPCITRIAAFIIISFVFITACAAEPTQPVVPPTDNQVPSPQSASPSSSPDQSILSDSTGSGTRPPSVVKVITPTGNIGYEIGDIAPDFTLKNPDGMDIRLSDYRGKTVLLHFWDIGCPKCVAEMPLFQEVWEAHRQSGDLAILAVNLGGGAEQVRNFMKGYGYTFPALLDSDRVVNRLYDEPCCPGSYVINRGGIIINKLEGVFNNIAEIEEVIE